MDDNEVLSNKYVTESRSTSLNRLWDIFVGMTYAGMLLFFVLNFYEISIGDGGGEFNAPTSTNIIFLGLMVLL